MTDNNLPQSIDYSSRDFYSIKNDLVARIQTRLTAAGKQWNGTDPGDFGLVMVEAFAHAADVAHYYIDRVANESYLDTAIERQSILNLAEMYGYIPAGYRQASIVLTFTNSSTTETALVPSGTQFYADVTNTNSSMQTIYRVTYTLQGDVEIPIAEDESTPGVATGLATHGINCDSLPGNAANPLDSTDIDGELLGYSNGTALQSFTLASNQVADNTLEVYVHSGTSFSLWTQVRHIADYNPNSPVYSVTADSDNYVTITFGDSVSGAIPTVNSAIKARYVIGGGEEGNLPGGRTFQIGYVPPASELTINDLSVVSVSNSASNPAAGGVDPETNDNIRQNAPLALRTMQRAVTLSDFAGLAISVDGVGKAVSYASSPSSINLYVSKSVSDESLDYYPGYDGTNTVIQQDWYDLSDSVTDYLSSRVQIGTSVTTFPPNYIPVHIDVEYEKFEGYTHAQIQAAIKYEVVFGYGYNYISFDEIIYPEQIEAKLLQIPGIKTARVVNLYRVGETEERGPLVPVQGELFVFTGEDAVVYPIASLSNLELSTGTLTPAFQPSVFSYRVTDVATSTITITPTTWDETSVVVANSATVASGATSPSLSTPTGTTNLTVAHTAADGTTKVTYTITVIR
jgi:hypothetical protein